MLRAEGVDALTHIKYDSFSPNLHWAVVAWAGPH